MRGARRHRRATSRPSWSSPRRAGTPLAELEALLAEQGQCLPSSRRTSAPASTVGGMVAAGLSGPARAARRLGARLRARRHAAQRPRRAAALRRPGHEERRRLRRLAPARRLARHPRRHRRGHRSRCCRCAPAEATLRFDMQARPRRWRRCNDWGGAAAAAQCQRAGGDGSAGRCACAARAPRCEAAARRSAASAIDAGAAGAVLAGLRDHATRSSSPPTTRRARTRRSGACRCRRPRRCSALAGDAADRVARRPALAARPRCRRRRLREAAAARRRPCDAVSRPATSRPAALRAAGAAAARASTRELKRAFDPARHLQSAAASIPDL